MTEYLEHVDPPQKDEGWIEYALQLLWSETDGYERASDNAAAELAALRERVAQLEASNIRLLDLLKKSEFAGEGFCWSCGLYYGHDEGACDLAAAIRGDE